MIRSDYLGAGVLIQINSGLWEEPRFPELLAAAKRLEWQDRGIIPAYISFNC